MSKTGQKCHSTTLHEGAIKFEEDLEAEDEDEEESRLCATTATNHDTLLETAKTLARHVIIVMILITLLKISLNC